MVDSTTHMLPEPHFVIGTQNLVEVQDTFPLPEAQLDRFLLQLNLGYPTKEQIMEILKGFAYKDPLESIK